MTDIRYVCLSDLHFGEEDSLMTHLKEGSIDIDTGKPSSVMEHLVECLKYLISQNEAKDKKPILILNGDILEFALATTNQAAMVFRRFIELTMPSGDLMFEKIVYIPGNHDHHIWEVARETQYVENLPDPEEYLPVPRHTTDMFIDNSEMLPSYFLDGLINKYPHLKDFKINVAYPNYGLISNRKCVIFHHGHFIEPFYQLMSNLKNMLLPARKLPQYMEDLETENFAWIDFFWSTMGRSGEAGEVIESIYEKLYDPKKFDELLSVFAKNLAKEYDLPGWGDWMEEKIMKSILSYIGYAAIQKERTHTTEVFSKDLLEGLNKYMTIPLQNQILLEHHDMPDEVSFVFGHTHKPFQKDMNFKSYPEWVNVYNTGGWVVESITPKPVIGGAVVLLDEKLNLTSLRMFNQAKRSGDYLVKVEYANHTREPVNHFHLRIKGLVNPYQEPWSSFSKIAAQSVDIRIRNMREKVNRRI